MCIRDSPKPDEFRTKPAWQRFLVMIAGVVMNVLLDVYKRQHVPVVYVHLVDIHAAVHLLLKPVYDGVHHLALSLIHI